MNIDKKKIVQGTLLQDAFVMVNKKIARFAGFVEAGILGEMNATHNMCENKVMMSNGNHYDFYKGGAEGEWFYLTQPYIEKNLGIKRAAHDTAIKNLIKLNLIKKEQKGLPAKSHYLINFELVFSILFDADFDPKPPKKATESLMQSGCMNPATKSVEIQQPRAQESSNLECMNPASIKRINKNHELKELNKKESIYQENINNLEIPSLTKKVLTNKMDRLILFKIDLLEVEVLFKNSGLADKSFADVLLDVLNSDIKKSFKGKMQVSIQNYIKSVNAKAVIEPKQAKAIRTEIVPDWMKEDEENGQAAPEEAQKPVISEERKREIWEQVMKLTAGNNDTDNASV
jgi:hypothetical protein